MKWTFPAASSSSRASAADLLFRPFLYHTEGVLEAGFKLSSYSGGHAVRQAGRLIDSVSYGDMPADWSYARGYGRRAHRHWTLTSRPTPGYPNTDDGLLRSRPIRPTSDIVISEVLCANNSIKFGEAQKAVTSSKSKTAAAAPWYRRLRAHRQRTQSGQIVSGHHA